MDLNFVFRLKAKLVVFIDDLNTVWKVMPAHLSGVVDV